MCTFFNSMLSITAVREDCFSGGLPLPTFVPLSTVSMFFQKNFNLLSVTAPIWRKKIREMTAAGIDLSTNMPAHKPQHPLSKRRLQSFAFLHFFFFLLKLIKSLNISWKLNEIESVCGMILTDQSRLILIVSKLVNHWMCWRLQQTIFLRDLLSARIRIRLLSGITTPTCIDVQLERKPTAAEGYGKAIKEVFCRWIWAERL